MEKRFANYWPAGSVEYVVMHGAWQESKGRNPSASYMGERNPREALATASTDLALTGATVDTLTGEVSREEAYTGVDRVLVRTATLYRASERACAIALTHRNRLIQEATAQGTTRRAIGEVIDLSPARIQQIVTDRP